MNYAQTGQSRWIGVLALLVLPLALCSCQVCEFCKFTSPDCELTADRAKVCQKPTVHALAADLDKLEKHIEKYGSVVAKQPDVWGQARLTKYREEFEQQMA